MKNEMKILYVYAHPEPKSFNAALKDTALDALKEKGHEVKLSDLYAMKFHPGLKASDFPERKKPDVFNPFFEAILASKSGTFAPDIKEEMEKVKWADLIIFQFPIYFTAMSAIMKGWIDRVLAPGFGFNPITNSAYDYRSLQRKVHNACHYHRISKGDVFRRRGARRPEQTSRIHNSLRL